MNEAENNVPVIQSPDELAKYAARVLDERKAHDIRLIHVADQTIIADYFVVCTGTSSTHIKSLADEVEYKLTLAGNPPRRIEGDGSSGWILLDFASVIVHVFGQKAREFYNIEKLFRAEDEVDLSEILSEE